MKLNKIVWISLIIPSTALCNDWFRPRTPDELPVGTTHEVAYPVPGAELVYVNYKAIQRDFPEMARASNETIDRWILDTKVVIGADQAQLEGLRTTHIPQDRENPVTLYRPPTWRRAGFTEGMDLKGVGHVRGEKLEKQVQSFRQAADDHVKLDELRDKGHSDGSMSLGEALVEVYMQENLQRIANRENKAHPEAARIETVENYFIAALPYHLKRSGDKMERAALLGRQMGFGRRGNGDVSPKLVFNPPPAKLSSPVPGDSYLQQTNSGAVVDFGATLITDPEVSRVHSYRDLSPAKVETNTYIDAHHSDIYRHAYELARDLDMKPDSWPEKRRWFTEQFNTHVPLRDTDPAELSGNYKKMTELFHSVQQGKTKSADIELIFSQLESLSKPGSKSTDRLQLHSILSILSLKDSKALIELIEQKPDHKILINLISKNTGELNHSEAISTSEKLIPRMNNLYSAMILYGSPEDRKFAIENATEQLRNDRDQVPSQNLMAALSWAASSHDPITKEPSLVALRAILENPKAGQTQFSINLAKIEGNLLALLSKHESDKTQAKKKLDSLVSISERKQIVLAKVLVNGIDSNAARNLSLYVQKVKSACRDRSLQIPFEVDGFSGNLVPLVRQIIRDLE